MFTCPKCGCHKYTLYPAEMASCYNCFFMWMRTEHYKYVSCGDSGDKLVATLISLLREMEYGRDGVCFFCAQRKHTADCKLGTFLSNLTTKDQND
jgi:hypothetical protein